LSSLKVAEKASSAQNSAAASRFDRVVRTEVLRRGDIRHQHQRQLTFLDKPLDIGLAQRAVTFQSIVRISSPGT
jgi:hypothetical protein